MNPGRYEKIAALRFDGLFTGLVDDKSKGKMGDIVRTIKSMRSRAPGC